MKWFIKYEDINASQIDSIAFGVQKNSIKTEIVEIDDIAKYIDDIKEKANNKYLHWYDGFTGSRAYLFMPEAINIIDIVKLEV